MSKAIPNPKLVLFFSFLSLVIFLLDIANLLNFPKKMIFYITNPVSFGIYNTHQKIGRQFHFIFAARFAAQENKALKEQTAKLFSENAQLRKKLAEAESLLSQEKHLDPKTYNLLPARPIGLSRYLKIDKGSSSGIKVGQAAVFEDNYLGKVKVVTNESANIELLTDPDSKVSAFSHNQEGKAKGILGGQFGTEMILDKILHEEKVSVGDLVYSEGLEEFLPRGLILGSVTQVLERENEVFKQAKVIPVFNIGDLDLVFVITD
ncbi:MAG: rod shape-determining protein MreC [Candidatus Daviesbacteria bacterium]|nr:rod shape-determining protein MreC [Candidatus Daviesbacteria bacterium]